MKEELVIEYINLCHELVCINHGIGWTKADEIRETWIKNRIIVLREELGLESVPGL